MVEMDGIAKEPSIITLKDNIEEKWRESLIQAWISLKYWQVHWPDFSKSVNTNVMSEWRMRSFLQRGMLDREIALQNAEEFLTLRTII